jgi:hypothetical protein
MELILRRTNIVEFIQQISSVTGGDRPQVPLCALFQAQAGT